MKAMYRITNKQGATVCFQVAKSAGEALDIARMYQRGDLIHIDSLPASKAPPATAESLYVYRDGL